MDIELAIIIPAYKAAHLPQALASIAAQTDQRFRVYVGDDASPEPIAAIVSASGLAPERVTYKRFETNLGGRSLIQQWDRCIRLSTEPWVWLFSDDDEMEPGCVAAFHERLKTSLAAYDLYRFNVVIIDANGKPTTLCPPLPQWESARSYAYFFLRGLRHTTQQESIFRRQTYESVGGIIELPLAWYADAAFAISCSRAHGVSTIAGPLVRFRLSGENISSKRSAVQDYRKWNALIIFTTWLKKFIQETSSTLEYPTDAMLLPVLHERFLKGVRNPRRWIRLQDFRQFRELLRQHFPESLRLDTVRLVKYNLLLLPATLGRLVRRSSSFSSNP